MGAKTWMIVGSDGDASEILKSEPELDREATASLARRLFPGEKLTPEIDGSLLETCPGDDELVIGCFPGLSIVAAAEVGIDYPSKLPAIFRDGSLGRTIYLVAMHSVVDWAAFAVWRDGRLVRSLSLSPDSGILEDIGERLPFEAPFWAGEHPAVDPEDGEPDYPFPFHPLELGEAALLGFFGYQLEGVETDIYPEEIPLMTFRRSKSGAAGTEPEPVKKW
jgi:hypothetical protein